MFFSKTKIYSGAARSCLYICGGPLPLVRAITSNLRFSFDYKEGEKSPKTFVLTVFLYDLGESCLGVLSKVTVKVLLWLSEHNAVQT